MYLRIKRVFNFIVIKINTTATGIQLGDLSTNIILLYLMIGVHGHSIHPTRPSKYSVLEEKMITLFRDFLKQKSEIKLNCLCISIF